MSATSTGARKASGQKAAKAARRATKCLDAPEFRLFSFYGDPVPSNKDDLCYIEETILEKLSSILQVSQIARCIFTWLTLGQVLSRRTRQDFDGTVARIRVLASYSIRKRRGGR